ncbi:hypothetical protein [Actinacidiphila glaucinigra]|uniref:hypothetical protein n=1 Tax=Actinacidiphila glaucinigra TaxID=235986 RepID=UPI00366FEEE1
MTAATGTLALGLAACGDSAKVAPKAAPTQVSAMSVEKRASLVEAVRSGAKAVGQQGSAKVAVESVDTEVGTTKSEGTLSWKKGAEAAEVSMDAASHPDLRDMAGPDGKVHLTMAEGDVYLPVEGVLLEAAGGKKWLRLEGSSAEDNPAKDLPHGPATVLAALSTAADLAAVGEEQVAGAAATHYTGTVDIEKLAADTAVLELVSKGERDAYVDELHATGFRNTVDIEAWIGAGDLAVKVVESGKTAEGPAELTIAYSGYGRTSAIKAPPAKDVTTFAEVIQNAAQG